MNTIDSLLKSAAPAAVDPEPGVVEADLARGRAARVVARRRRIYRRASGGLAALALAGAAVAITVTTSATGPPTGLAQPSARVQLVDFTGDQLPGFTVSQVPQGWQLSTSVSTALCITPADGSVNDDPYDFEGKLCVMPQSVDELGLGPGDPVTVNGQPGRVDSADGPAGSLQLRYITTDGHTVDVQSPTALHWTDAQIVAFAQGVQVTEHIGVTHG
jgi:hypothetical protein